MKKKMLKNVEWGILVCSCILIVIGIIALFSATYNSNYEEVKKQVIWLVLSIPVVITFLLVDYQVIVKFSPIAYIISLILLVAVLFTSSRGGATSWFDFGFFSVQPAEIAKIVIILVFAKAMVKIQEKGKGELSKIYKLILVLLIVVVPVLLIVKQPDYGTALAFIAAVVFMLFVAGIKKRYIILSVLLVVVSVPLLYMYVLPQHAKTRIDVFMNPELDPQGSGYNVIQSKLAIGSGELLGMGVLKGNQTQLGFLYPKTTDFIFSVIGEEMGFVIGAAVIVVYVTMLTKSIYVAKTAKDDLGSYIVMGIVGVWFYHMVENIGMTMGLLPITGVPLPFVSYGGSALLTNFICIALVLNVSGRRKKSIFIE